MRKGSLLAVALMVGASSFGHAAEINCGFYYGNSDDSVNDQGAFTVPEEGGSFDYTKNGRDLHFLVIKDDKGGYLHAIADGAKSSPYDAASPVIGNQGWVATSDMFDQQMFFSAFGCSLTGAAPKVDFNMFKAHM
ncbi:MAG: hypothetical protein AB7T49_10135 [Oligoflexales bacterium]